MNTNKTINVSALVPARAYSTIPAILSVPRLSVDTNLHGEFTKDVELYRILVSRGQMSVEEFKALDRISSNVAAFEVTSSVVVKGKINRVRHTLLISGLKTGNFTYRESRGLASQNTLNGKYVYYPIKDFGAELMAQWGAVPNGKWVNVLSPRAIAAFELGYLLV